MANTEHIFNIAISFDEETIMAKAMEKLESDVAQYGTRAIFENNSYYRRCLTSNGEEIVERCFDKIIAEHKQEIIDLAVKTVADRIYKSKALKEAVAKLKVDLDGNS